VTEEDPGNTKNNLVKRDNIITILNHQTSGNSIGQANHIW